MCSHQGYITYFSSSHIQPFSISKCRHHQIIFTDFIFSKKIYEEFPIFLVLSMIKKAIFAIFVSFVIVSPMSIVGSSLFFHLFHKGSSLAILAVYLLYKTNLPCVFYWLSIMDIMDNEICFHLNVNFLKVPVSSYILVYCTTSKPVIIVYCANKPKLLILQLWNFIILWQEIQTL